MTSRKPTPYSSFENYNNTGEKYEEKDNVKKMKHQMSQVVSKNSPLNQANQVQTQSPRGQQMQGQQMQGQQIQDQTRIKHVKSSEHLYNLLTNSLAQFQSNFTKQNIQPPPMRMFIKLYTEWCEPCKKLGPILDEISMTPDTRDIIFMKFDADLMIKGNCHYSNELKKMLQVNAVPVMFGFVDGKHVGTVHGADMKEIYGLIDKLRQ